ncbi:MAG: cobalamin B12-binding domain-containing protein [Chloroflexi bacterium]|nr:cobalamin B12-binding domain-containing protein [Chloroflexota bacterium]
MKVLLIAPNYRKVYRYVGEEATMILPPIGLAYIAAFLREEGIPVEILDLAALNLDDSQTQEEIERRDPDIVGITAVTNTIEEAYNVSRLAKRSNRKVIVGGAHASILPEQTLEECKDIDITARGEGEHTLLEIARGKPLNEVKGISYRVGNTIVTNPPRPFIKRLDELPFPAWDLLPLKRYWSPGVKRYPFALLVTSRGCPYSCSFCTTRTVLGKEFRSRSPENVIAEVDELVNRYGVKEINIVDDNFTLLPDRAEKICDLLIEREYDLIWKTGNGIRADRVTYPLILKMKRAGCYFLAFGVESGNQKILDLINKGETLEQIRTAVKWAKEARLMTEGFFMIGNDGEGEKEIRETIEFAKELDVDFAQFQIYIPFPGSSHSDKIISEGNLHARSWKDYNAFNKPIFSYGGLTPELMERMQKIAYREYYLRPQIIFRKTLEIRSFKQLKAYFRAALSVLKFQH